MALAMLSVVLLALAQSVPSPSPSGVDPATLGPGVGQPIPPFEAPNQDGRERDFASVTGPNGLVLVFFRSADW